MNYHSALDLARITAGDRPFLLAYTSGPSVNTQALPGAAQGHGYGPIYGLYATAEQAETARQKARDGEHLTVMDARVALARLNGAG